MFHQAHANSQLFVTATKDAVFSLDLDLLANAVDELLLNKQVLYVRIYDHEKLLIKGGNNNIVNRSFHEDSGESLPQDGIFDIIKPITESGYTYGHIEMGFDTIPIQSKLNESTLNIISIAAMELFATAFFSFALGIYLTKHLTSIDKASTALRSGNIGYQIPVTGSDEIAQVATSFNIMSRQIEQLINTRDKQYQLIHSEVSLLSSLLSEIPFGIMLGNHQSDQLVFLNTTLCNLLSFDVDKIIGTTTSDTIQHIKKSFRDPKKLEIYLNKTLSDNKNTSSDDWQLSDGRYIKIDTLYVNIDPKYASFYLWVFQDNSQIKLNQRVIRQRSNELSSVFNLIPDGLVLFNNRGEAIRVNKGFNIITGLQTDDILGRNLNWLDDCLRKKLTPGQKLPSIDYRRPKEITKDSFSIKNDNLVLHLERIICFDNSEPLFGGIVYYRNVSDQKKVELIKSEFLSTAAHELRTPMANIYGYSELLLNTEFNFESHTEFTKIIHHQCERLTVILDDLLDLAKIEANGSGILNYETQNLDKLIHECIELFYREEVLYNFDLDIKETPPIICDKNKINQVINNIINNAIKYSPGQTTIHISVCEKESEGVNGAEIIFQDEGIGMTSDQLSRVFERFYRADSSGIIPGTGLGLSIVKEIITLHNGKIEIESEFHKGTTVIIWLPCDPLAG